MYKALDLLVRQPFDAAAAEAGIEDAGEKLKDWLYAADDYLRASRTV